LAQFHCGCPEGMPVGIELLSAHDSTIPQTGPLTLLCFFQIDKLKAYTYNTRKRNISMQKKLTITVDEEVYKGLYNVVGARKISKFIEDLVRPHVVRPNLELAYREMGKDREREEKALEWAEATFRDIEDEKG